ncbi:hypothetical protein B0H13DRAFT_2661209 [Mycena leptocephala]|nr:hypothetical protein B0H13DRAFT_2661209 [Mycena leptocephala]
MPTLRIAPTIHSSLRIQGRSRGSTRNDEAGCEDSWERWQHPILYIFWCSLLTI